MEPPTTSMWTSASGTSALSNELLPVLMVPKKQRCTLPEALRLASSLSSACAVPTSTPARAASASRVSMSARDMGFGGARPAAGLRRITSRQMSESAATKMPTSVAR